MSDSSSPGGQKCEKENKEKNKNGKIPDSSGVVTPVHRTIQQ